MNKGLNDGLQNLSNNINEIILKDFELNFDNTSLYHYTN